MERERQVLGVQEAELGVRMLTATLSFEELFAVTGYRQVRRQLGELHIRGFIRARLQLGKVILERVHYEAVCRGLASSHAKADTIRPKVQSIRS
jgi:hypothetical protein